MSVTIAVPPEFFDAVAASLLAATNGPATVGEQLQHLDVDTSTRATPADVQVTLLDPRADVG